MKNAASGKDPYRFVLVDYRLTGANGKELAEWVKAAGLLQDTILFMTTALAQVVSSSSLEEDGFSACFIKPIYPDQLKAALKVLWTARQQGRTLPLLTHRHVANMMQAGNRKNAAVHADLFLNTRVLVAEDMKVNLMLITRILEKHGCIVSSAVNGKEAVRMMREQSYDIVFMDCQMPEMDGFEATRFIRKEEGSKGGHTVIVALTADAMTGDREKCLQAGMDDYLNKPLKAEQITSILKKWVGAENPLEKSA